MTILVTGGAGYIGSHAVWHLLEQGYSVVVVDNLSHGFRERLPSYVPFVFGDVGNRDLMRSVFSHNKVEAVLHFAGAIFPEESMQDPHKYLQINVAQGLALLEVMREFQVKHIIFSSSAAVYGNAITLPITEDIPTLPMNVYGQTKLLFEDILQFYDRVFGLKFVALRYFNVAGAGYSVRPIPQKGNLIPQALQVSLGKSPHLIVFGTDYATLDGTNIRDYIHVLDLVRAHVLALQYLFSGGQSDVINLGTGKGASVLEVIDVCCKVTGHPVTTQIGSRREGDPITSVASFARAKKILGWEPQYDLRAIVQSMWDALQ